MRSEKREVEKDLSESKDGAGGVSELKVRVGELETDLRHALDDLAVIVVERNNARAQLDKLKQYNAQKNSYEERAYKDLERDKVKI